MMTRLKEIAAEKGQDLLDGGTEAGQIEAA